MQFEYDPERLIEEVKNRPGLWDIDNVTYGSKTFRNKLWGEVVEALLDGAQLKRSEIRELELQLQKKWKGIRDSFVRYIQYPERSVRPYIYSTNLAFLLKQDQQLSPPNKHETSDEEPEKPNTFGRKKYIKRAVYSRKKLKGTIPAQECSVHITRDPTRKVKKECSGDDFSENDVNSNEDASNSDVNTGPGSFTFANVESNIKDEPENCNRLFLLSLLPHLKAVPEDNKINAKMQLMQVLNAARNYVPESNI